MNPILTQGLITAGGGLAGSLINGALGIWQANKDREYNAEQAELNREFQREERLEAQEYNLDMWNLNNDYNDIGSQIERARAAGVNPMAIVGGSYKGAQSNPVTTSPQSGSTASSSAGGSVGSALIGSTAPLLASAVGGVKQLADAKVAEQTLPLVKQELQSRVDHNYAQIQKYAHENGYTDIQRDMVAKSIHWMDGLNQAEITKKLASANRDYNECYDIYQRIAESQNRMKNDDARVGIESSVANANIAESQNRMKNDDARVGIESSVANANIAESQNRMKNDDARVGIESGVANANIANTNASTAYQNTVNKYADKTLAAQMSQEEIAAWEAEKRKQFANDYDLVLGTSEFEFAWQMHCKGKYAEYCDKCILPAEQATWKPEDYTLTDKTWWRKDQTRYYFGRFNPRKGVLNPAYTQGGAFWNARKSNYRNE